MGGKTNKARWKQEWDFYDEYVSISKERMKQRKKLPGLSMAFSLQYVRCVVHARQTFFRYL